MFERYTERARRVIFFARYEASQFGSPYIETEHLLLGVLREDKALAYRFLGPHAPLEAIRKAIEAHTPIREKILISVDLPLSRECKRVLTYASEEAERLKHKHIGTAHLLLGLLREEKSFAAELLHQQGLTLNSVRAEVQQSETSIAQHGRAFVAAFERWLAEHEARGDISVAKAGHVASGTTDFAIYAADARKENENLGEPSPGVPLLCIEIISDDSLSDVQKRCDEYIDAGVSQVWILDPNFKRAYTVTKTEGLRECKDKILRIIDPPVEMDLQKIFG